MKYDNASTPEECEAWKRSNLPHISRLHGEGFTVISVDESMVTHQTRPSRMWQDESSPSVLQYSGRHSKTVLLGGLASDGSHVIIRNAKNDTHTFLRLVKKLHETYGRCVLILDNYRPHKSRILREYVEESGGDIVLKYLPRGAPHLNAIEECWHQIKNAVTTAYYETFDDLKRALSAYIRYKRFNIDVFEYLRRSI